MSSRVDRAISRARRAADATIDAARSQLRLTRAQRATWKLTLTDLAPPPLTARSSARSTPTGRASGDGEAGGGAVGYVPARGDGGAASASCDVASLPVAGSEAGPTAAERATRARCAEMDRRDLRRFAHVPARTLAGATCSDY